MTRNPPAELTGGALGTGAAGGGLRTELPAPQGEETPLTVGSRAYSAGGGKR